MKLQLDSDFHQYYDAWFDKEGFIWDRFANNRKFGRRAQFKLFDELGIKHPEVGIVGLDNPDNAVIYEDEYAHCGEGKFRSDHSDKKWSGKLYSKFILSCPQAMSFRDLWIGNSRFFLQYVSDDEWRSNWGNVMITPINTVYAAEFFFPKYDRSNVLTPMFAIDYVREYRTEELLAVDFNTAPGINGTPIQKLYEGKFIAGLIKEWFSEKEII